MGLARGEKQELARLWRPDFGAAEVGDFARRYAVSKSTIWRATRAARRDRQPRADAKHESLYVQELGLECVLFVLGQVEEGVAVRDAIAAARSCGVAGADKLSRFKFQRALDAYEYQIARMRARGPARPDGSRAPMVKRSQERLHANSLHQYDETRAPCMFVDERDGMIVFDPELRIDWSKRQAGKTPLWVACTLDDASRARWFTPIPTPSAEAVLTALGEAWSPKPGEEADGRDGRLPFFGLPEQVYGDNGSWLSSETVRAALKALGVRPSFHHPYHPESKGKVERAFLAGASLWAQERLARSSVELKDEGRSVRRVLRMTGDQVPAFFLRMNLLFNNRVHAVTGEAPFARWCRLIVASPESLRAPPPAEVFAELRLARLILKVEPNCTLRMPGGERVGLDWAVFGPLVGREVETRFKRLERGRAVAEGETVVIVADGNRWEVARRAPAPDRRLDYREQPVTPAEVLSAMAGRVDYAGHDLTRHAAEGAPTYRLGVEPRPFDAGRIADLVGRRMMQIGRYEAIERLQAAGRLSRPMSDEDSRRADAWLGGEGTEVIDLDVVDAICRTGAAPAEGQAEAGAAG